MRIMGIDPGIERTGFAILDDSNGTIKLLDFGCIKTSKILTLSERLLILSQDLQNIILEWKPEIAGIEELFFSKNVKTALTVSHARGVILAVCEEQRIPIHTFNPGTIKSTVTGDGRADKSQIQKMLQLTFGICPKSDDAADAIACVLCLHSHLKISQATTA